MKEIFFQELLSGVQEMVAIENGELQPKQEHVHRHVVSEPDFKLRKNSGKVGKKVQKKSQ